MKFSIKKIVLWPRNKGFDPRVVEFHPATVNAISGESRTGKSAIIPIIDYCLGADKCAIPVKTIRDACEWFGVLVETEDGDKLFARREPGEQRSTGDMFVMEGANLQLPRAIESKNANVELVKNELDDLSGLSSLDFSTASIVGFKSRASFRDLMAFTFQPQNVVANPNVLFYKTDTYEHREKLRVIFPYVLGVVTSELLAKQHQLAETKKELRRKEQELISLQELSDRWFAELQANLTQALELGLIDETAARPLNKEDGIRTLRRLVSSAEIRKNRVTGESIGNSIDEIKELREQENEAALHLSQLRQRFLEMTELRESAQSYRTALRSRQERLAVSRWLHDHSAHATCPICGSDMGKPEEKLESLLESLEQVENQAAKFQTLPGTFDREYQRVRTAITKDTERLGGIQSRIQDLEERSEEERKIQYTQLGVSRFLGRLESDIKVLERIGTDSELQSEIDRLRREVRVLEGEVAESKIKERLQRALRAVEGNAGRLLPLLDLERPQDPISLLISDLTISVGSVDREDLLSEIGSGSNWLAYHIAVSLALQLFFLSQARSPVPNFLVIDQPSQVYFPKRLVETETPGPEPVYADADVQAVRKVFNALSTAIKESNVPKLQVIVLDHAPATVWENLDVWLAEEWRDGRKLVPLEWLASPRR